MDRISHCPQVVHVLILRTCEYVTFQSKRDFADVIKLRILRQGGYPGLLRWTQYDHSGLYQGKREAEASESEKEM